MKINFSDVQRNVSEIANRQEYSIDVLYELMAAYGRSASSITKLRNGVLNLAEDKDTTILQRGVVYFKVVTNARSLPSEIEKLEQDPLTQRYNPRFLIATDLKTFAAKDTKKSNTLEITWAGVDRNIDFFYGWTGDEVIDEKTEAAADRRAADKMKELYQEIEKVNLIKLENKESNFRHHLNVFFTRLLFCFFAEDTNVFSKDEDNIFTTAIRDFTQTDGSDLDVFLATLFESLDVEDKSAYTSPYSKFPYVNGKLFDKSIAIEIPKFNAQARHLILSCGALSWAEINPDIFGSMFQSIVDEDHRSTHGMHYTSVPNIMKTIEPLFLDELREEFDTNYDNKKKLEKLHDRISKIKIFDPACGSGNFLIIAYKELRKLEHAIIERLYDDEFKRTALAGKLKSTIELDHFYGIEIDDFACEVAVLSLYLAKHQMNIEFEKQFGKEIKLIPLVDTANIVHGNAARLNWQEICPNVPTKKSMVHEQQGQLIVTEDSSAHLLIEEVWDEIYLIGNPPYLGSRNQDSEQKADLKFVSKDNYKSLDYVCIWFIKGAEYIFGTSAKMALVSTNSVTQGELVSLLWPNILRRVEIGFAHLSFSWSNSAKGKAGVTCVIISLRNKSKSTKYIYDNGIKSVAKSINGYLAEAKEIYISRRSSPLSQLLPPIRSGSMPNDGGNLVLSDDEKKALLAKYPDSSKFVKQFMGSADLIRGVKRWIFFIGEDQLEEALKVPDIKKRLNAVTNHRLLSSEQSTKNIANSPNSYYYSPHRNTEAIIVPLVSSERREYIPCGYVDGHTVISNLAFAIYDAEPWLFSVINSRIHLVWMIAIGGKMESRYRYSSSLVYNNFPIRQISEVERRELNTSAQQILLARQNHTEKTLAEMYDPDKMPNDLREAHHQNDLLVDKLYRQKPYANDEERLADLFKLYEEMVAREEK